jgi:8-oxo-dGTP diphosphatase
LSDEAYEVAAAGGVVTREGSGGRVVLVVHRPDYDDWTLPKGKLDPGESFEQAALREVEEETGLVCELGEPCGETRYEDSKGRSKLVRYWLMTPVEGEFEPNDEVDELVWLTPGDARALLTYERDGALLARAL